MRACCGDESDEVPLAKRSRKGSRRARVVWLLIIAGLAAAVYVIREKRAEHRSEVVNAMKQFGLALLEFDQEFGGYPSDATAGDVAEDTGSELPMTGEDVLNQLKAFGVHGNMDVIEEIGRKDGGWIYVPGSNHCGDPGRPILVSPPINGERIVLRIDNSVDLLSEGELDDLPDHLSDPVVFPKGSQKR